MKCILFSMLLPLIYTEGFNLGSLLSQFSVLSTEVNDALSFIRAPNASRLSNKYIIKLHDDISTEIVKDISSFLKIGLNATIIHEVQNIYRGFNIELPFELPLDLMKRIPHIDFIEEDQKMYSTQLEDLSNPGLWGLDILDGSHDNKYNFTMTGQGVNVYILDSGIDQNHPEFNGRANSVYVANFLQATGGYDCTGHGTHVAGTIGGTNVGVAKLATLNSLRVIGCQDESLNSEVIAAIDWISANHQKPAVINMSLGPKTDATGTYPRSSAMDRAIQQANDAGITFIVAAGNDELDCCGGSPCGSNGAIPVAASDQAMFRASFSNFGECVKFLSPGNDIISAKPGGGYTVKRGTSQAAPFVTGAVALYLQQNPDASPSDAINALQSIAKQGLIKDVKNIPNVLVQVPIPAVSNSNNLVNLANPSSITDGSNPNFWSNLIKTVGLAIGIVGGVFLLCIVGCCYVRRRRSAFKKEEDNNLNSLNILNAAPNQSRQQGDNLRKKTFSIWRNNSKDDYVDMGNSLRHKVSNDFVNVPIPEAYEDELFEDNYSPYPVESMAYSQQMSYPYNSDSYYPEEQYNNARYDYYDQHQEYEDYSPPPPVPPKARQPKVVRQKQSKPKPRLNMRNNEANFTAPERQREHYNQNNDFYDDVTYKFKKVKKRQDPAIRN